jgi:protein-S-isoprenylcysteine O-methyltransferase Ste14
MAALGAWRNALKFTTADRLRALVSPQILVMAPIYLLGLIPAAALMAYCATFVDRWLGLPSLAEWLSYETRLCIFAATLVAGGAIVTWTYTYLVLEGGGGPVPPFSSQTRNLVTNGPYAIVRHPSIWGKLLGVIGLGVFVGSITFLLIVIPALLTWSLQINMPAQDRVMEAAYGDAWREYRDSTPALLPWLRP